MNQSQNERCTFAIISHPDAGKTTLTEKLLLYGNAINMAGTVKSKKADRYATSDWMALEKQRGISVTTSVMQFPYQDRIFNLLDTPGHADFSEDTYRTLTAVDSALMVIDSAKGVEERTIKLMDVCRLRTTPIVTFVNKIDRAGKDFIDLLDEIESVLQIKCAPITWPIGSGKEFVGLYHLLDKTVKLYPTAHNNISSSCMMPLTDSRIDSLIPADLLTDLHEALELVHGATTPFTVSEFLQGRLSPVFFGSALSDFGIEQLLTHFAQTAPLPQPRETVTRIVTPDESKFSGFVFKIQANMDPQHRDRVAFLRICSGRYTKGMKVTHVRLKKQINVNNALNFMASDREVANEAAAGDILGLHNHGTIQIGDTFTEGEGLKFLGIPNFAPELFQSVRPVDPLKAKALQKGLTQLAEEGATQVFRPLLGQRIVLGAVGQLQFDVVAHRLQHEYRVACVYEPVQITTVRWLVFKTTQEAQAFEKRYQDSIALDGRGELVYLASSWVNLQLVQERCPDVEFHATREYG